MTDMTPTAPTVLSLTFDYDNIYAPDVRGGGAIEIDLATKLAPGQRLRLAFGDGYINMSYLSTFSDGEHSSNILLPGGGFIPFTYTVSGGGTHISCFASSYLLGDATSISVTASASIDDPAPVVTTTDFTLADPSSYQLQLDHIIENFPVLDVSGREQPLLDNHSTRLGVLDIGALWCLPTQVFLRNLTAMQAVAGSDYDFKSLLFENAPSQHAEIGDAALAAYGVNAPGDVFVLGDDDRARALIEKALGITGFGSTFVIDQVTGEVLNEYQLSTDPTLAADYLAQTMDAYLAKIAATKGIVRIGTNGSDVLAGSVRADVLVGGAGRDFIDGGYGNDRVSGGDGDDGLTGGAGDDRLRGKAGNDRFSDLAGHNRIDGGDGTDAIDFRLATGGVEVDLGETRERGIARTHDRSVSILSSIETVNGSDHNDVIHGSGLLDTIYGGMGDDKIFGGGTAYEYGYEQLSGEAGNDEIWGGAGIQFADGGAGEDVIHISAGNWLIADDDTDIDTVDFSQTPFAIVMDQPFGSIFVVAADPSQSDAAAAFRVDGAIGERVIGTDFGDTLIGGPILLGGKGNDTLSGLDGNDTLYGQQGRDVIDGGDGDDYLAGGSGADTLTGGAGADQFFYDVDSYGARDTITDFSQADGDRIGLDALGPLVFVGSAPFDGDGAGEVRASIAGENTLVFVDIDGDKHADLTILLHGASLLTADDFILTSPTGLPG